MYVCVLHKGLSNYKKEWIFAILYNIIGLGRYYSLQNLSYREIQVPYDIT